LFKNPSLQGELYFNQSLYGEKNGKNLFNRGSQCGEINTWEAGGRKAKSAVL
jgi:hypothetical protein